MTATATATPTTAPAETPAAETTNKPMLVAYDNGAGWVMKTVQATGVVLPSVKYLQEDGSLGDKATAKVYPMGHRVDAEKFAKTFKYPVRQHAC